MSTKSNIEWTESTWNPVTGCTKISAGCQHCYAERTAAACKQWGGTRKKKAGRVLEGQLWNQMPRLGYAGA